MISDNAAIAALLGVLVGVLSAISLVIFLIVMSAVPWDYVWTAGESAWGWLSAIGLLIGVGSLRLLNS